MTALLDTAALLITVGGLVAASGVLARTRDARQAVAVLLDLLTAAGLVRLAGSPSWVALLTAALVIALRRLAGGAPTIPDTVLATSSPKERR